MTYRRVLRVFILVPPAVTMVWGFVSNDFRFAPYLVRSPWPHVWLLMLIFYLFGVPYFMSKSLLHKHPFRFGSAHFRVDDEGILVQRSQSQSMIRWPLVQKATENSAVVILSLGAYTPIVLPKRFFDPAQLTVLRSLIRDHVQANIQLKS